MDFIYLFRVLLKKKWIIIGAAFLAAAVAYFATQNEAKKYLSTAQMSTGFTTMDEDVVNDNTMQRVETETKFNNVTHIMTSSPVISLLSYNLILHDLNDQNPYTHLKDDQRNTLAYKQVNIEEAKRVFNEKLQTMTPLTSYKPDEKKLLEFLSLYGYDYKGIMKRLAVYRFGRTDYIQIDFYSHNPELSSFAVNTLYSQFLDYTRNTSGSVNQATIDTLKSIMDKRKQEADIKAAVYNGRGGAAIEGELTPTFELISALQKDLSDEKSRKNQLSYDLKKVELRLLNFENTGSSTNTPSSNDEIVIARSAMQKAFEEWNKNPNDQQLRDRYNQAKTTFNDLVRNMDDQSTVRTETPKESKADLLNKKNDILQDIQASNNIIGQKQSQINMLQGTTGDIGATMASTESLKKEWEQANKEYLQAKQKYTDATESFGSPNKFRQVVKGQPAIEPEPSKRLIIVAMAGTAALVTTMLIIILLTYLDSSIKTPQIFTRAVNLKMISMINYMDLKNKDLADIVANRDGHVNIQDRNKFNAFRESIRKLRYEIESSRKKTFLFTSTKKGQGKTTLIQALSYSMSLSKKKILIIDTNFCNNDLTVQLQAEPVLEKIVPFKSDAVGLLEQVRVVSKDIGVGSVYAIGSEGGDYTPSEILPRENLLQHLHQLTAEFDYIFLEGPPLNDFSDSKELAEYVEGVIAVFSAKQIIKQIDKQSIAFFKELNGKFCGSILNMVDLENVNVA